MRGFPCLGMGLTTAGKKKPLMPGKKTQYIQTLQLARLVIAQGVSLETHAFPAITTGNITATTPQNALTTVAA